MHEMCTPTDSGIGVLGLIWRNFSVGAILLRHKTNNDDKLHQFKCIYKMQREIIIPKSNDKNNVL